MPELSEISLTQEYVEATCMHKKIVKVDFPSTALLQAPKKDFIKVLQGNKLEETRRLGKYLFLKSSEMAWLVFHFGMTGKLEYYESQASPEHSHMLLTFEDHSTLAFLCRRKLGKIFLTETVEKLWDGHGLGKDALDFSHKDFEDLMRKKKGGIKAALTNQHLIAGIGNVYSDEILYQAGIHPKTKIERLNKKEKERLWDQIPRVLKKAIKLGGKRSEFPSDYLIQHRSEGADCPKCKGKIEMIKVGGRSSYFCPGCQKEKTEKQAALQL